MTSRKHNRISRWTDSLIARTLVAAALALTALSTTGVAQTCTYTPLTPPGKVYPLFDYQLANGGSLPQTFTYQMEEDAITMTIAEGASVGVAPNQVRIVLTSAPNVTWRKEIVEWSGRWGRRTVVATQDGNHGPVSITLTPATCAGGVDTIVFKKAKLYGIMFDMYHLEIGNFSRILRGKVVTFNWVGDTWIQNPYPMSCVSPCVPLGTTRRTTDIALTGPAGWTTLPVASSLGDGSFRVTNHPIGDFAIWASTPQAAKLTGDFNGDGRGDIALTGPAGWQSLPVAFSNGNGTFTETNAFVGDFAGWASHPQAVKLTGDFNGDRKTDIALTGGVSWNDVPVALSNGNGTFNVYGLGVIGEDPPQENMDFALKASDPQSVKLTGDFNGDGRTDIALTGPGYWTTLPVAFGGGPSFSATHKDVGAFASWASYQNAAKLTRDLN